VYATAGNKVVGAFAASRESACSDPRFAPACLRKVPAATGDRRFGIRIGIEVDCDADSGPDFDFEHASSGSSHLGAVVHAQAR